MTTSTEPRPTDVVEPSDVDIDEKPTWMSLRARVAIIVIGAIAVLVIAGAIIFSAIAPTGQPKKASAGASPASNSASSPAGDTTLTPIADTPMTSPRASTTLNAFLVKVAAISPKTKNLPNVLVTVASGAIVAEIENSQAELKTEGWTQKGVPVVTSVKLLKSNTTAATPTATVEACVDSSKVVVYDSKGKVIPIAGGKAAARSLNIYSLQSTKGHWRVVSRTFPNNPTC